MAGVRYLYYQEEVMNASSNHAALRRNMVERQLAGRGIRSPLVLDAMSTVRREGYVPSYLGEFAYDDTPLPIEEEQTISQPYIVAVMTDALELQGGEKVLEIGTGSGYAAAVLGQIAAEVYTVERHELLAKCMSVAATAHWGGPKPRHSMRSWLPPVVLMCLRHCANSWLLAGALSFLSARLSGCSSWCGLPAKPKTNTNPKISRVCVLCHWLAKQAGM